MIRVLRLVHLISIIFISPAMMWHPWFLFTEHLTRIVSILHICVIIHYTIRSLFAMALHIKLLWFWYLFFLITLAIIILNHLEITIVSKRIPLLQLLLIIFQILFEFLQFFFIFLLSLPLFLYSIIWVVLSLRECRPQRALCSDFWNINSMLISIFLRCFVGWYRLERSVVRVCLVTIDWLDLPLFSWILSFSLLF